MDRTLVAGLGVYIPNFQDRGGLATLDTGGNSAYSIFSNTTPYSPTEFQVYPNAASGQAGVVAGGNTVTRVTGPGFQPAWAGRPFFYYAGTRYLIDTVTDGNHLTVKNVDGSSVSFAASVPTADIWHYCVASVTATINVSGTAVTWVSGPPFYPFISSAYINGTEVSATYVDAYHLTLASSLGTLMNAQLVQYILFSTELSTLRVQGLNGNASPGDEESLVLSACPEGYELRAQIAGSGKYRPIRIATGESPVGSWAYLMEFTPGATLGESGSVSIGGKFGRQSVLVNENYLNANYWDFSGGAAGNRPQLLLKGSDATIGGVIGTKGAGDLVFTSMANVNTNFSVLDNGGAGSYLAVQANGIIAAGTPDNIDVILVPKGAGVVRAPCLRLASGQDVAPAISPGIIAGRYYFGLCPSGSPTAAALLGGYAIGSPFFVPQKTTFTKIGVRVVGAALGSNVKLAIYQITNGVIVGGPVASTTAQSSAAVGVIEVSISAPLPAGFYCLFIASDSSLVFINFLMDNTASAAFGRATDTGSETLPCFIQTVTAAWATSPGLNLISYGNWFPQIWLRK